MKVDSRLLDAIRNALAVMPPEQARWVPEKEAPARPLVEVLG